MTAPEPTAEHIHWTSDAPTSLHGNGAASFGRVSRDIREVTCRLCHSLYPEHARERDAALAASLPAEVMLAALVDRGTLTERRERAWTEREGRLVQRPATCLATEWEVAP